MEENLEVSERPAERYIRGGALPPPPADVDWSSAPGPFKVYRHCHRIPLGSETPRRFSGAVERQLASSEIGHMLLDIYGLTRERRMLAEAFRRLMGGYRGYLPGLRQQSVTTFLRPVPSGGALFPCELYLLVGRGQSLPAGIYHYDALHHALDLLREGDYMGALNACLADPGDSQPDFAILLSCFFWKNGFKYGEFSYRLQSLDLGVVTGQAHTVADRYGRTAVIHYRFLDLLLNRLVGLDTLYESVYSVVTFGAQTGEPPAVEASSELIQRLAPPAGVVIKKQAKSIAQWPLLEEVHTASLITSFGVLREAKNLPPLPYPPVQANSRLAQEVAPLDLLEGLSRRHTTLSHFQAKAIGKRQFAALLSASAQGYANDLDGQPSVLQHTLVYCVVNAVEGISPGVYLYHPERMALHTLRLDDVRSELQAMLYAPTHNMAHVGACFIPVGNYEQGFQVYGDRWYRIQNMEAGLVAQRLSLGSAALNLGCHIILQYHIPRADALLRLPQGFTSLAQILVGPEYEAGQYYAGSL